MTSSRDRYEKLIKAQIRKIYSETVIENSISPRNVGDLENADGFARVTGPCGDTMEIWLKVKHGTITDVSFMTDGCGTTVASGSIATQLAKGKSASEAQMIGQHEVLNALGGLPEESEHCALLAANTLKAAIRDYLAMNKEPWKRAYRKN